MIEHDHLTAHPPRACDRSGTASADSSDSKIGGGAAFAVASSTVIDGAVVVAWILLTFWPAAARWSYAWLFVFV
jgi:hypothetical protein